MWVRRARYGARATETELIPLPTLSRTLLQAKQSAAPPAAPSTLNERKAADAARKAEAVRTSNMTKEEQAKEQASARREEVRVPCCARAALRAPGGVPAHYFVTECLSNPPLPTLSSWNL